MGSLTILALLSAGIALALGTYEGGTPEPARHAESLARRTFDQPGTTLSQARLTRSAVSWVGGPTAAKTGETVTVYVSSALAPEFGTPQMWADFLAGLVHGPELSALTAYIATFTEMQEICGVSALGCYGGDRMMSMGETMYGITAAEVVRHEYGHHIAFHRMNAPWQAIDWGPKNWASAENVCKRAGERSAYPGDEGDHYSLNPGEAWAETYRMLDERRAGATGSGWQIIDPSFFPDEVSLLAAERDVLQPWTKGQTAVHRRNFSKQGTRVWTIPLRLPLDGVVDVAVTLPASGLHEVVLLDGERKTVLAKGLWASTTAKKITVTACGNRLLLLRVTQKGAFGKVAVTVSTP